MFLISKHESCEPLPAIEVLQKKLSDICCSSARASSKLQQVPYTQAIPYRQERYRYRGTYGVPTRTRYPAIIGDLGYCTVLSRTVLLYSCCTTLLCRTRYHLSSSDHS